MDARALVFGLLALAACGDGTKPNTPRESVRAFGAALTGFDYDAIRPHVIGDEADLEHLQAFFEFARAGLEFKTKFLATYGDDGWATFNDNEEATVSIVQNGDLDRFDRMRYEFDGDRAVGTMPNESQKLHLERDGRRWFVRLRETMGVPERQLRKDAALYRKLAPVFRKAIPRIGAEGVTPAILDTEIGAAMEEIFREAGRLR